MRQRRGTRSVELGVAALGVCVAGFCLTAPLARAEVGYAMRGDARPFHQWDSRYNATPRGDSERGIVWRVGDVSVRPTLGAWAGTDDNVFLDHRNPSNDTSWTVAPGLLFLYGKEDGNYITAHYEFERVEYTDFSSEDYDSHLFSLGLQLQARGYTTHLSEQYGETTDAEVESGNRVRRTESTTQGRVDRQFTDRTGIEVHGSYETVRFDADNFVDYSDGSAGVDLRHRTWSKTYTRVGVDAGRVDVSNPDFGDADYVEGSVGLSGEPVARTTVDARLGYQKREFDDAIATVEEWVAQLGASRTFWRDSAAGINLSRRILPSSQTEGVTRVPTAVTVYVQHELLRDLLAVNLSGTYESADYHDPAGDTDRTDDRVYATGILDWRARDMLTVGAGYTYERLDSGVDDVSYERNLVFLRALANY